MKLWQKIFLVSMTCIFIAVEGTAVTVTWSNFRSSIQREETQAVASHNDLVAGITNRVLYERLRQGKILLAQEDVLSLIEGISASQQSLGGGMALYYMNEPLGTYQMEFLESQQKFRQAVCQSDGCLAIITRYEEFIYCLVGSTVVIEGLDYTIYTITDITSLYTEHARQLRYIGMVSMVFAAVISLCLMMFVFSLLAPLRTINASLQEIAGGNYSLRLKVKGNTEFKTLAGNINIMAESIEEHVERLQGIADDRKQFIDSLAHEMKTPLTSIMGFSDILRIKRVVDDKQRQEYADIIVKEANRLKSLSGKILELATTESVHLDYEEVSVKELFTEVSIAILPILEKRKLRLRTYSEELTVRIDRELFKSLLYNLLDNAIKASDMGGEIRLQCIYKDQELVFSVSDDGIGMSPEQVKRVIEPFYMVDKSRSRKAGGAGLGLALCKEIAKRHDARLVITSKLGEGTTIHIRMKRGTS